MPQITFKNQTYCQRWTDEENHQLLMVGRRYGHSTLFHYKDGHTQRRIIVDWKAAEKAGALKGLPNITLKQLSQRHSQLKRRFEGFKRPAPDKVYIPKKADRFMVWTNLPDDIKKKHGHKPRQVWTEYQKKLLFQIAKDHSHTNVDWKRVVKDERVDKLPTQKISQLTSYYNGLKTRTTDNLLWTKSQIRTLKALCRRYVKNEIDWVALMKDKRLKKLPKKYRNDLHHLRKYYWGVVRADRGSPEFIERHRSDALRWKRQNRERYRQNQTRRTNMIRDAVNEFLNNKVRKKK